MTDIFKKLDFAIREANEIILFYDQSKKNNILIFCMTMLERLKASSDSLRILLADDANYRKVEYSCGIIIRSFLLDYMIVLNAADIFWQYHNGRSSSEKLEEFCLKMLTGTVKHTIENIISLNKKQIISNEIKTKIISNIFAEHENCFEKQLKENGEPVLLCKDKKTSCWELFEPIHTSEVLKDYEPVLEAYLFYSKYDHFGQMSYSLQRKNIVGRISSIENIIGHFPNMIRYVIAILAPVTTEQNRSFLVEKAKSVVDFINDN